MTTAAQNTERWKRLRATAARLNDEKKGFGPGTVVIASDVIDRPPRISTGSLSFDVALGGGWPPNQWNEIIGDESSGKSAAALKTVARNQQLNKEFITVWVAAEGYDEKYATMCGVDNSMVLLINTNIMEEAYETVLEYLSSRDVDLIVVDSLPALSPEAEYNKEMGEASPGIGALLTGKFFRKSYKATKRSLVLPERPVFGLMINQYREKIGVMFGDPRTTPGGKGKNFRFYTRVEARRDEFITTGDRGSGTKVGQSIKFRVVKNKSAPPQQVAVVDFYFKDYDGHPAGSYDNVKEIANLAMLFDIAEKRGNGYVFEGQRYVGKQKLFDAIGEDAELRDRLRKAVLEVTTHGGRLPDDPEMAAEDAKARASAIEILLEEEDAAEDEDDYESPAARHRQRAVGKVKKDRRP